MEWKATAAVLFGIVALQWFASILREIRAELRAVRATQLEMLEAETYDQFSRHTALMKAAAEAREIHGVDS